MKIFNQINKPIYFVTGNHEFYIKNYQEKISKLNEYGITLFDNKHFSKDNINIVGIGDNQKKIDQLNMYLKLRDPQNYNLLLIHKPSIWDEIKDKVDLMLSGHCHNGQIIPFNFFVKITI